jgi:hypothetical protein
VGDVIFLKIYAELKKNLQIEVIVFNHVEGDGGFEEKMEKNISMME